MARGKKRRSTRDNQRSKVYRLSQSNWGGLVPDAFKPMSLKKCQRLIDICYYRLTGQKAHPDRGKLSSMGFYPVYSGPPLVADGRSRRSACYSYGTNRIKLPVWSRHGETVIHEVAHSIVYSGKYASHGAEFMKVHIRLLSFVYQIREAELRAYAKEHRVKSRAAFPIKHYRIPKWKLAEFRPPEEGSKVTNDTEKLWKEFGLIRPITLENVKKYIFGIDRVI